MKVGVSLPQGCAHEFLGIQPAEAWRRTIAVARDADAAGFESLWVYDHFKAVSPPEDVPVFEPFVELTALAMVTERARLGHLVLSAAYRNAALTAKMISTLDVVSGGRAELGIGAGWNRDEWLSYGYGFPETHDRLAILADHLEIITRMFGSGTATYEGRHAHVRAAILEPKGLQRPRVPIVVGGNGPKVTWRLAARFADELNLDGMSPTDVARALPVIRAHCEEVGRDPATLRVSVHFWGSPAADSPGAARQEWLGRYEELGLSRVIVAAFQTVQDETILGTIIDDCNAVGLLASDDAAHASSTTHAVDGRGVR